jgi:hypothetical protein
MCDACGLSSNAVKPTIAHFAVWYGLCNLQVVHVEIVRAYGRLVRLVLQHDRLLRQLQSATAALQHEAQLWEEVPVAKEAACYKYKEEIDKISQEIQVNSMLICL